MNPMKRVGLVAVLVVGVTLFVSTAARAGDAYELENVGDESLATGQVTLGKWTEQWFVKATVSCQNLTPGATYCIKLGPYGSVGTLTANRNGNVKYAGIMGIDPSSGSYVRVNRLDPDGSQNSVLWFDW